VNSLNGVPARQLRPQVTGRVDRHIRHRHFWSPSNFTASRGGAPLNITQQYIQQQKAPVNPTSGLTPP
jgi:putative transposase